MNSNYQAYLDYLASFVDSHSLAVQAKTNIYPLFADFKRLINHYRGTIEKFENVQIQLGDFIEQLNFDDGNFNYYQEKFIELRKVDGYLQELRMKQVSDSISNEIQSFISNIYLSASIYKLETAEEQVLSFHNKIAEIERYEKYKKENDASQTRTVITIVVIVLAIILLIVKCYS